MTIRCYLKLNQKEFTYLGKKYKIAGDNITFTIKDTENYKKFIKESEFKRIEIHEDKQN